MMMSSLFSFYFIYPKFGADESVQKGQSLQKKEPQRNSSLSSQRKGQPSKTKKKKKNSKLMTGLLYHIKKQNKTKPVIPPQPILAKTEW